MPTKTKAKAKPAKAASLELDPDAWPKFEKLIKSAAKIGHKPHKADPDRKRPLSESKKNAAVITFGNSRGDVKN